jgi:DNA-binding transcriptional regulator YiaG
MDGQDWTPVVVKKSKPKTEIIAKSTNPDYVLHKKLEDDTIHVKPKMFSHESKQAIIQYRIANKLSQTDLDARCSFPKNTIQQLEANKRAPTTKELQTLNRVLKTGLTLSN